MINQDLGIATAYGYAKSKGYTGSEDDFATLMANYASVGTSAAASALKSEGFAVGEQNGTPVTSGSPYYQNNAKYYVEQIDGALALAYSSSATYEVGDYVMHSGGLYRCISAISTAEAWTAAHWTQVAMGDEVADLKTDLNEIVDSYTIINPYLAKKDAYITTSGTYTAHAGTDTYKIPINNLDIVRLTWSNQFWDNAIASSAVFTVEKNDGTFVRFSGYNTFGALYLAGKDCLVCGTEGIKALYVLVKQGYENLITLAINEPFTRLVNDVKSAKELTVSNSIRTNFYIGGDGIFNYFNSPYGAYFVKLKANDKLLIGKSITGVPVKGRSLLADGTYASISNAEYTASADCIVCIFDNTSVLGKFTVLPSNSIKIASNDIIGDISGSAFSGLDGVAFGTSLTYRAISSYGYLTKLSDLSGITFDNQGIGSSYILGDMLTAIKNYSGYSDKRVCLLEGFVNDWHGNKALGTYTDTDETTVCGCVRSAINYMLSQNANMTVFLILDHYGRNNSGIDCSTSATNGAGKTQFEYYEEIAKVAESMGIPVIKEYAVSQISENTPQYLADNIHLNALGAVQSAYAIWSQIKQYYPNLI